MAETNEAIRSGRRAGSVDDEPCDICGAAAMEAGLDVSLLGIRAANVGACRSCGFRQVRPRLGPREIAALYPAEYFLPTPDRAGYRDYAREEQRAERDGYFLARKFSRLLPRGGRLLEVGCGPGFLLRSLARFAPRIEAEGVDISESGVRFARSLFGLRVHCGTLESAGFPDAGFDVILQKDLLEHVASPREHLKETARVLRPGGFLWLVTPNGDANLAPYAALARRSPGRVPLLDQGHLSFFRKEHLSLLLAACGFETLEFRNLKLIAGLRALGRLPRSLSRYRSVPRTDAVRPSEDAPTGPAPPSEEATVARMAAAIEGRRSRLRSSAPYFWFRHLVRASKDAPAFLPYGLDFEILLRKIAPGG